MSQKHDRRRLVCYVDASEWGGAEQSLLLLLQRLPSSYDVTVAGVDRAVLSAFAESAPRCSTQLLPAVRGKWAMGAIARTMSGIRALRPDILHLSKPTPWSAQYALLAGWSLPATIVVAVEQLPIPASTRAQQVLGRIANRRVDGHVSVGLRSSRVIERTLHLPPGSVHTIYNSAPDIAASNAPPVVADWGRPLLVTVARLDRQKGLDVLLQTLPLLPGVAAILVGDGPEHQALIDQARQLGVQDRVHLVGWQAEPRPWLAAADIAVLPSRNEALPLSLVEAMLAERPVVATDVGSVAELVVHGTTGLLVPADDVAALATALRQLLDHPELCAQMGSAGRERALGAFTPEAMTESFLRLYDDLLAAGRVHRRSSRRFLRRSVT